MISTHNLNTTKDYPWMMNDSRTMSKLKFSVPPVAEAGVQLEDYDYAHDTFDAPNGDDFNGGVDDSGDEFGAGNDDVMPLALDPDLMDDEDEFAARKSSSGESLFGGRSLSRPSLALA